MMPFVLFDGRARSGDTDDAQVIDTANTEREAKRITRENMSVIWMTDAVWYQYDLDGKTLINERMRDDLS